MSEITDSVILLASTSHLLEPLLAIEEPYVIQRFRGAAGVNRPFSSPIPYQPFGAPPNALRGAGGGCKTHGL